jgi:hypothetical protein
MVDRYFQTRRFTNANVCCGSIETLLLDFELVGTWVGNVELVPAGSIGFASDECLSGTLLEPDLRARDRESSFVYDCDSEFDGLRVRVCHNKAQKKQNHSH